MEEIQSIQMKISLSIHILQYDKKAVDINRQPSLVNGQDLTKPLIRIHYRETSSVDVSLFVIRHLFKVQDKN